MHNKSYSQLKIRMVASYLVNWIQLMLLYISSYCIAYNRIIALDAFVRVSTERLAITFWLARIHTHLQILRFSYRSSIARITVNFSKLT